MTTVDDLPTPPAALKERVTASLRSRGTLRSPGHWSRIPLAIAAGIALFVAGTRWPQGDPPRANNDPAFALLLYEDAAFQPQVTMQTIVTEYTAWAADVADRGDLVLAEELDPVVHVAGIEAPPETEPLGQLTGMFVVHAADREAALELARGHPHLRHGGRIVVRGFVRHS